MKKIIQTLRNYYKKIAQRFKKKKTMITSNEVETLTQQLKTNRHKIEDSISNTDPNKIFQRHCKSSIAAIDNLSILLDELKHQIDIIEEYEKQKSHIQTSFEDFVKSQQF